MKKECCLYCEDTCGSNHGCQNKDCDCHDNTKGEDPNPEETNAQVDEHILNNGSDTPIGYGW